MIHEREPESCIALYKDCFLDWRAFGNHVNLVRRYILEKKSHSTQRPQKILNLCQDRYHFLVAFTASMLEDQITVMPANSSEGELARLSLVNEGIQKICDREIEVVFQSNKTGSNSDVKWSINDVPESMVVAELYTSGSTGVPSANLKTWGQLTGGVWQVAARFGLLENSIFSIIATIPPQHMFGFEMSVVMPLVCGVVVHHEQPFYPLDIQSALRELPSPRLLITTPIHLNACSTVDTDWPGLELIVSATAPLSEELARQVEKTMNTRVKEVYGCSETGAVATRRLTKNNNWKLLTDYVLSIENGNTFLRCPARPEPVLIPDLIEMHTSDSFELVGRSSDLIKIGGKRGSISDITACIKSVPGVIDAAVFMPENTEAWTCRLAAIVVAPGMTPRQLRDSLVGKIDPVFTPRPLCIMPDLPYTKLGKLPRANLLKSLDTYLKVRKSC